MVVIIIILYYILLKNPLWFFIVFRIKTEVFHNLSCLVTFPVFPCASYSPMSSAFHPSTDTHSASANFFYFLSVTWSLNFKTLYQTFLLSEILLSPLVFHTQPTLTDSADLNHFILNCLPYACVEYVTLITMSWTS